MHSRPIASPDDIEMSSIAAALKSAAPKLIGVAVLLAAATFAILAMMAPRFQSQAELAIVAKGQSGAFADPKAVAAGIDSIATKMDKEAINTHVRALQSPDLMERIAEELKLAEKPEFNSAIGPVDTIDAALRLVGFGGPRGGESERDRVLNAFRNQLEVYSAKESRFIGVRFASIDPALAAEIANRLAETYRSTLASQGVSEIDDQQMVLQGKIDKLTPELADAETVVDRYRGEINVFKGGPQNVGLNEQQMSELTGELTRAKAARGEAEARARGAREMMKDGAADALPDVQKSPLIQNLVQQRVRIERQLSELSASLLPGHPRMQQLNADLAGLKKQLNGEISKLVDGLEKEAKVAQGREEAIKKSLDELKTRFVTNAPEEAKLRQLEANAKAKRTELENLQTQLEANRKKLDTRAQPVEAQLISRAQPASVPIFPKKGALSALVAVAWMLFGTAWTVTKALFVGARGGGAPQQPRIVVTSSAKPTAPVRSEPTLAGSSKPSSPLTPKPGLAAPKVDPVQKTSETTIAGLARSLAAKRPADGGHRTMITGETLAIDATGEAIDLAKALSGNGSQVILVDWSPSGLGLGRQFGAKTGPGLTELLLGQASFEDVVARIPGCSVHFIGCGAPLDSTDGDIEPEQLNLVLDALDEAYDFIVVAGPHEDARALFEAIQGRFDAGVLVGEPKRRSAVIEDPPGSFLGFEVADIDILRFERSAPAQPAVSQQRIARATGRNGAEALSQ